MKKFVIVGAGTAGAISAAIIKKYWGSEVDVSVYYDKSKKIIGVGESTAPVSYTHLTLPTISRV